METQTHKGHAHTWIPSTLGQAFVAGAFTLSHRFPKCLDWSLGPFLDLISLINLFRKYFSSSCYVRHWPRFLRIRAVIQTDRWAYILEAVMGIKYGIIDL